MGGCVRRELGVEMEEGLADKREVDKMLSDIDRMKSSWRNKTPQEQNLDVSRNVPESRQSEENEMNSDESHHSVQDSGSEGKKRNIEFNFGNQFEDMDMDVPVVKASKQPKQVFKPQEEERTSERKKGQGRPKFPVSKLERKTFAVRNLDDKDLPV